MQRAGCFVEHVNVAVVQLAQGVTASFQRRQAGPLAVFGQWLQLRGVDVIARAIQRIAHRDNGDIRPTERAQAGSGRRGFGEQCSTSLLMGAVFIGHAGHSLRSNGQFTRRMQNIVPKSMPR
ncbi:hypothetical protein ALP75_205271 [Pseudomonas syringae pv. actinidiae]|nr:hypothetical protein ALP75_205271 [Pseudomonas syringae pv. actinidiae]